MNELTCLFISSFNRIEKHLKEIIKSKNHHAFAELVHKAAYKNPAVKHFMVKLKEFAEVRNFFIHGYQHGNEVAIPTESTVQEIEFIEKEITAPPLLLAVATKKVRLCDVSDPIRKAARIMNEDCYSQLPVYRGKQLIGLLTGETISRWVAARLEEGDGLLQDEPVEEVLKYEEQTEGYTLLSRTATVFDAIKEFDEFLHKGKVLKAIILTDHGRDMETPLGIITFADIPTLMRKTGG